MNAWCPGIFSGNGKEDRVVDTTVIIVTALAFTMSFIFALGGIGSALALVPVLHWYGLPLDLARPTGLLINTLSMTGASVDHIRHKRLDFRMGIPIILASSLMAPVGVLATRVISHALVLWIFVLFLFFSMNNSYKMYMK